MTTREERKLKGICDRIVSGCAKRVGSNKNVFGANAAVQILIYNTALVRGFLNICHRKRV
jgi:hypothetical protein